MEVVLRYGLSWLGSKNLIAQKIIKELPSAPVFVDLFGGGGAMTHCAVKSGKYKKFIFNEISIMGQFIKEVLNGRFDDYIKNPVWISREMFCKDWEQIKSDIDIFFKNYLFCYSGQIAHYAFNPLNEIIARAQFELYFNNDSTLFCEFYNDAKKFENLTKNELIYELKKLRRPEFSFIIENIINIYLKRELNISYKEYANYKKEFERNIKENKMQIINYLRECLKKSNKTQADVNKFLGNFMAGHYFASSQWQLMTEKVYNDLKEWGVAFDKEYSELLIGYNPRLNNIPEINNQVFGRLEIKRRIEVLEYFQKELKGANIKFYNLDYRNVPLPAPSECVIYCDPPYFGTAGYFEESKKESSFNHNDFYNFIDNLAEQGYKVFFSEYFAPENRFEIISQFAKRNLLSKVKNETEKLFISKKMQKNIKQRLQSVSLFDF